MARKNEYNYFELKAQSDKKSRGNFILNLPDGDPIVITPFSVEKALEADGVVSTEDQLKYAMGDDQWDRLYAVIKDEEVGVLTEIAEALSEHFYGETKDVPGGKRRSSR